eukprot:320305_1
MSAKRVDLYEKIEQSVDSFPFLKQILQHIPPDALLAMIKHEFNKFNDIKINKIYHAVFPIDHILPTDIIQEILSFDQYSASHKLVSKTFKNACDRNEHKDFQNRIENEPKIDIQNKYFRNTNYWIVDPTRTELTTKEIAGQYNGPINNVMKAISKCKSGDTLLIYDGVYSIKQKSTNYDDKSITLNKKIAFIGIGSNVIFKQTKRLNIERDIYFKNISFIYTYRSQYSKYKMCIYSNVRLFIEKCRFKLNQCCGICMHYQATNNSIYLRECQFSGNKNKNTGGIVISISKNANDANIVGCQFRNCGFAKQDTKNTRYIKRSSIDIQCFGKRKIRIVGNIFINEAAGMAITTYGDMGQDTLRHTYYEIRKNVMCGRSSIVNKLKDPNMIHQLLY